MYRGDGGYALVSQKRGEYIVGNLHHLNVGILLEWLEVISFGGEITGSLNASLQSGMCATVPGVYPGT